AIFMARDLNQVPSALLHALKHNKALHERVVMMQVDTEDVPHVLDDRRLEIAEIGKGFYTMRVRYGFMDEPNIMRALALCRVQHFRINLMDTSFLYRPREIAAARHRLPAMARPAVHVHEQPGARCYGVFPHSTEPRRRARRPNRNLAAPRLNRSPPAAGFAQKTPNTSSFRGDAAG